MRVSNNRVIEPIIALQEEERRTIISENREDGENVYNPQLSEAIARHQENQSRLREESERRQQEMRYCRLSRLAKRSCK